MPRLIKINTNPGANRYAGPDEKIIEFSGPNGAGGLIGFRADENGDIRVSLYRLDPNVTIVHTGVSAEERNGS